MSPETTAVDFPQSAEINAVDSPQRWLRQGAWGEEYGAIQNSSIARSIYETTKSRAAAVLALETEADLVSGKVGKEEFTRTAKTIAALAEKLNLPLAGEAGLNTDVRGLVKEVLRLSAIDEEVKMGLLSEWFDPNFASVAFHFDRSAEEAVKFHFDLNHLLTMAELKRFDEAIGHPFDRSLLCELRNGGTMFATAGKVTAQHLPLPRPELIREGYTYQIGSRLYKVGQITPKFHASRQFLNENTAALPISDFRHKIVITQIKKEEKNIVVQNQPGPAGNSIVKYVAPSAERFFYRGFDEASHDCPWSVALLKDSVDTDVFWAESIVLTAEQGVKNRRQHATPYLVRIKAKPETMAAFKSQLEQEVNRCVSDKERHELLYFLTSVLYFQADPDYPYLTPDVMPGNLDDKLPHDLNTITLGAKENITEAPVLFRQALKQTDGFDVLEALYNTKREGRKPIVSQLMRVAFGPEYKSLASAVKGGLNKTAVEVEKGVGDETNRRLERNRLFEQQWQPLKVEMVKVVGGAFGLKKVYPDSPEYDRIAAMMKVDDEVGNARAIHFDERSSPDTDKVVRNLQIDLILNAGVAYIDQLANDILQAAPQREPGRQIIKRGFVKKWNSLVEEVGRKWNIPKELLNQKFLPQLDSDLRFSLGHDTVAAIKEAIEKNT